ncbi:MAG TPA: hypothetical protein VGL71_10260 [Urbifossiella sp.]|jgi:hypothetical protein
MLLFCPDCQSAFTGVSRCPRCSGLLLMPEESPTTPDTVGRSHTASYQPTPISRAIVGTITALGLYLGFRRLTTGWVMATFEDADSWWLSEGSLIAIFVMQMISAGFGAMLASAGRSRGIALGGSVGGICGGLFLAAEIAAGAPPTQLVLLLQPFFLAVMGAIAGTVGAWVWPPLPEFELPQPRVKKSSSIDLMSDAPKDASRPTVWYRILIGATIIVAGMTMAEKARSSAEKASGGLLKVSSRGQGNFMSWQIATLAVLAGGAFAGAGTGAGIRHGVYAGLLGGIGITAFGLMRGELSQPEEYLLNWMNLAVEGPRDPVALLGVGLGVMVATFVGGWFGGQLFVPLAPLHMRKRRLTSLD